MTAARRYPPRSRVHISRAILAASLLAAAVAVGCDAKDRLPDPGPLSPAARAITDGVEDSGHPYVGLLLVDAAAGVAQAICTATVVGRHTLLTAAHCCKPEVNSLFQLDNTTYQVVDAIPHPDWVSYYENDIGLVKVLEALPVSPAAAGTVAPAEGMEVTLVGYGRVANDIKPDGTKRVATNTVDAVFPVERYFTVSGTGNGEGNTCLGDSGGPVLASVDGNEIVVGVISSSEDICGVKSYHAIVSSFLDWLLVHAGGDFYRPPATAIFVPPPEISLDGWTGGAEDAAIIADGDDPRKRVSDGCSVAKAHGAGPGWWTMWLLLVLGLWRCRHRPAPSGKPHPRGRPVG